MSRTRTTRAQKTPRVGGKTLNGHLVKTAAKAVLKKKKRYKRGSKLINTNINIKDIDLK